MTERDPEAEAETTHPRLVEPVMIAAFEGWNDAGEAASTALEHLELMWDAEPLAAIDPEDYYDFQVTRRTCGSPTASPAASNGRPRGCPGRCCRHRAARRARQRDRAQPAVAFLLP
jgi:hypothetical protein